mgnify:CR=1 FL=1
MGLYDTIYVEDGILNKYNIKCSCEEKLHNSFQTKDLNSCLEDYYLRHNCLEIKLFKLDKPDEKYWHEYTDEEIKEHNQELNKNSLKIFFLQKGDGYLTEDGWKVENRFQRDMGALPHQWLKMYDSCLVCKKWIDVMIKFTNGVVEDFKVEIKDL